MNEDISRLETLSLKDSTTLDELDFMDTSQGEYIGPEWDRLRDYARSLPYRIESNKFMQDMLDFILKRMVQCVKAKSFDPGFMQWDSMLSYWKMLKYPIPKDKRIALAKLYLGLCVTPGMPLPIIASCCDTLNSLLRSKKKLTVDDLRLPWKKVYNILKKELFLSRRQFEINQTPYYMGRIAEMCRRFFHPLCIDEMLQEMIPDINGTSLDSVLSTQYYLLTFLPPSHPQIYMPALLRLWNAITSYMYDNRMLAFLAMLAEIHVDPSVSDMKRMDNIPDDAREEEGERIRWDRSDLEKGSGDEAWPGIWKDVGIFTSEEWGMIMCKTLSSMEISLADAGSLTTGPSVDTQSSFEIGRLPRPQARINSLAKIIVYSMSVDGPMAPASGVSTPYPSETLGAPKPGDRVQLIVPNQTTFVAGSRALDSLIRLIVSTESFFHPSNSGSWTSDLSLFIRCIVYEFNKRWYEERAPDCKTPAHRRLTFHMRRELVRCLRTVALLGLFSTDSAVVGNILSCVKSMAIMEPGLLLPSILERAAPSLEALTETRRTTSMIKALAAIASALVSRDVYYPGAKHLLGILDLLLPGVDLNDPTKTLCTAAFITEISQHIKFGELRSIQQVDGNSKSTDFMFNDDSTGVPEFALVVEDLSDVEESVFPALTRAEEDERLMHTTTGFADWVTTFIRRVLTLMENLPEEKESSGSRSSGESESEVVDAIIAACSLLTIHLSEPIFDLVLNLVYDYASSYVQNNAVRAMNALMECMAAANPFKTLAKFFPFCERNIRYELENGASSVRTTSVTIPLPADSVLHWNMSILRGMLFNDGVSLLPYRQRLLDLFKMMMEKTYSKRGFSWAGKIINGTLATLTHTYPKESRFVNAETWNDPMFDASHHQFWGKLHESKDCKVEWHTPTAQEIDFALQIFREVIEPLMDRLGILLQAPNTGDLAWKNDFCRYLSHVRYAFAGIPTLLQEYVETFSLAALETSDLRNEIHEFIATITPVVSGFALTDPKDARWRYVMELKSRFGKLLCIASEVLREQGTGSPIDAIHILLRGFRSYMLEYGDSRESYFNLQERFNNEQNLARRHARQTTWPRLLYITKARFYHSARLRWNSLDRCRTPIHDKLIDELAEWAVFSYSSVRSSSQNILETLLSTFDGVRRRCLPILYKNLEVTTEDDRMKGALYSLNIAGIARYVMGEPTLLPQFIRLLFACQHNEKPSIQECVGMLAENSLSCFSEPNTIVYDVPYDDVEQAAAHLGRLAAPLNDEDATILSRGIEAREHRVRLGNDSHDCMTRILVSVARDGRIHWKYSILAVRFLRTLVRKDRVASPAHVQYFMEKAYDDHPSMRYYAQRAIMKSLRFIKLRTLAKSKKELALSNCRNPLKRSVPVTPTHSWTQEYLTSFNSNVDPKQASKIPILQDKPSSGWLVWSPSIDLFLYPASNKSTFRPWENASESVIQVVRSFALDPEFWRRLSVHFAEENSSETVSQDNISCVKSIFQVLEDEPLSSLVPIVEEYLQDPEQHKQRAAAELLGAIIGGSKHWDQARQTSLWKWLVPLLPRMLGNNVKTDTLMVWTSFLEYVLGNKDPRRSQHLVDYLMNAFTMLDFNTDSFFTPVKICSFVRAFSEELMWRFNPWMDMVTKRYWQEIGCDHEEIRTYISEALELGSKVKWRPRPSKPDAETFIRECRTLDASVDIMGIRDKHNLHLVLELEKNFPIWREQRPSGAKAQQSMYDKVAVMTCKWLYLALHDVQAVMVYDLVLPLMSELLRFSEVNDNEELSSHANMLLTRMCAVTPPLDLLEPILDTVFEAIRTSTSWRVRLKALPLVQVWYFRQFPLISESKVMEMLEVCCLCLDDDVIEVREAASVTLSGILRCSPRRSVVILKERFVSRINSIKLPSRQSPYYNSSLRMLHGAILGVAALIDSFPYTVEKWTPELLTDVLVRHVYDPVPVSTTVRICAANFKKTHQDTWHEDQLRFNEDQLASLSTLLMGSSYYA